MESPAVENVLRAVEAMTPEERTELFRQFRRYTTATPETVLYRGDVITIDLPPNVLKDSKLWQLEAIVGTEKVAATLHHTGRLDEAVLATLLAHSPVLFMAHANSKSYLIDQKNEFTKAEFTDFTPISTLDAVYQFGLAKVEEVREKTLARIS